MYEDYDKYDDCPSLEQIMAGVKANHPRSRTYRFSPEALPVFKSFHDKFTILGHDSDPFTECDQRSAMTKIVVSIILD